MKAEPCRIDAKAEGDLIVLGGWGPERSGGGGIDKGADESSRQRRVNPNLPISPVF